MKKFCIIFLISIFNGAILVAQHQTETKNVILITLDGFRWQELFKGADPEILMNPKFVSDQTSIAPFAQMESEDRRQNLLPFFWNTIAVEGQLYGNRDLKSKVNCANPYWFSYPGYHEILVGAVDRKVRTNGKKVNPNSTVLEYVNQQSEFSNKVGAFSTWDVFPFILRESLTCIPVNSGLELLTGDKLSMNQQMLNQIQTRDKKRYDSVTFHLAFEYLKQDRPRLVYIALDETDQHAHGGRYDQYLLAANNADRWISELWKWVQSQPDYKDQTTLLISTDHGRGRNSLRNWRNHGRQVFGSDEIWMAALGPDTPGNGEVKTGQLYQKQLAKTIGAFLGLDYKNDFTVGETIRSMIQPAQLIAGVKKEDVVEIKEKK